MQINYRPMTFAGAIPFVVCAAWLTSGVQTVPVFGSTEQLLATYALLIASFMAGVNWGQHLGSNSPHVRALPVISNAIAIAAWAAFLMLPFDAMVVFFATSFAVQLYVDWRLYRNDVIDQAYAQTRLIVSLIVIASLLAVALLS